jgi:hypothetical protein
VHDYINGIRNRFTINFMIKWTAPGFRIQESPGLNFRPEDLLHLLKYLFGIRYFLKVNSAITPQIIPGCCLSNSLFTNDLLAWPHTRLNRNHLSPINRPRMKIFLSRTAQSRYILTYSLTHSLTYLLTHLLYLLYSLYLLTLLTHFT